MLHIPQVLQTLSGLFPNDASERLAKGGRIPYQRIFQEQNYKPLLFMTPAVGPTSGSVPKHYSRNISAEVGKNMHFPSTFHLWITVNTTHINTWFLATISMLFIQQRQ